MVIGDVMLDRYASGVVERVSPEAPIPVFKLTGRETRIGGAGNVVNNILGLRAHCRLLTVVGDDADAAEVLSLLGEAGVPTDGVIAEAGRRTTAKERFVAGGQQILRVDQETNAPISATSELKLLELFAAQCRGYEVLVLSDYRKGVLTPELVARLIETARAAGLLVLIDPKGDDYAHYRGADMLTPNASELRRATGMAVETDEEVVAASRSLIRRLDLGGILATRSERGMTLVPADGEPAHIKAESREVFDITGAGDTVIATLSAGLAAGLPISTAMALANTAAGIVVTKRGTARVEPAELIRKLNGHGATQPVSKFGRIEDVQEQIELCRAMGLTVGFTNGCFDLLHPGHLALLQQARASCDFLIVGLNSDASVRRLKGADRPAQNEVARVAVLASLSIVDRVVIFDEDTPAALIEKLRPDVLIKGADYRREQVVGGDFVESYGGRVVLADISEGHSTSSIVDLMMRRGAEAAERKHAQRITSAALSVASG